MGQREVLAWAKGHEGWHELKEISEGVGERADNVCVAARKLFRDGDLVRKVEGNKFLYAIKEAK